MSKKKLIIKQVIKQDPLLHPGCESTTINWVKNWTYFSNGVYRQEGFCEDCGFGFMQVENINKHD